MHHTCKEKERESWEPSAGWNWWRIIWCQLYALLQISSLSLPFLCAHTNFIFHDEPLCAWLTWIFVCDILCKENSGRIWSELLLPFQRVIRWLSLPTCMSQQHMISRAVIGNGKARVGGGESWDYQGLPATCGMLPFTELQLWFIFLLHKDSHLSWTGFRSNQDDWMKCCGPFS